MKIIVESKLEIQLLREINFFLNLLFLLTLTVLELLI